MPHPQLRTGPVLFSALGVCATEGARAQTWGDPGEPSSEVPITRLLAIELASRPWPLPTVVILCAIVSATRLDRSEPPFANASARAARNSYAINVLASPLEKLSIAEAMEATRPGSFERRGEAKSFGKRDWPCQIVPILLATGPLVFEHDRCEPGGQSLRKNRGGSGSRLANSGSDWA
jgi:hypothetical protein